MTHAHVRHGSSYGDPGTEDPWAETLEELGIALGIALVTFGAARAVTGKASAGVAALILGTVAIVGNVAILVGDHFHVL